MSSGQPTQHWFPSAGVKAQTPAGKFNATNDSTALGMGVLANNGGAGDAINDEFSPRDEYYDGGTWTAQLIGRTNTANGISTIQLDGVSQGTLDWYSAALTENVVKSITGLTLTSGVKVNRVLLESKNASSTGYAFRLASFSWIRTGGTGGSTSGSDEPGHRVELFGWMGVKAGPAVTRGQYNTHLGGGSIYQSAAALNDKWDWDVRLERGAFRFTYIHVTSNDEAITSAQIDAVTVGTIDQYSAAAILNVVVELTGIEGSAAGVKTVSVKAASKNASSSNYFMWHNSIVWTRTGPLVRAGYLNGMMPWMGTKSNVGWASRTQSSGMLGGGISVTDNGNVNNEATWDITQDAGTHSFSFFHRTFSNHGIYTVQLGGITQTTIDGYSAAETANVYTEVTGIAIRRSSTRTFKLLMATKNASASQHYAEVQSWAWTRTG